MLESDLQDRFAELLDLGLVTAQQRDAALQHPELAEMQAGAGGSSMVLTWMVVRDIVTEEDLSAVIAHQDSRLSVTVVGQRQSVIQETLDNLAHLRRSFNHNALSALLDESIIDAAQFARAERELPDDVAIATPAAALLWMMMSDGLLSREEILAIRGSAEADSAFPGAQRRVEILAQTEVLLEVAQAAIHRAAKKEFWAQVLPGPRWLWVLGAIVFFGFTIGKFMTPGVAPACDDSDTLATVRSMLFSAHIQQRVSPSALMRGDREALPAPIPGRLHEVGYVKADKVRACLGTLKSGDVEEQYAYTVGPSPKGSGGFSVAGASPEMVQARYSHIDAEGKLANQAEPVGRAALEAAIRAGVDKFNADVAVRSPSLARLRERMQGRQPSPERSANPDRDREIADLEPNGKCRELAAGTRYACNVILERNDPLLASIGMGSLSIVTGDFTVERENAKTLWRVSDEFPDQYVKAIAHGRMAAIKGSAAAGEAAPGAAK